MSMTLEQAGEHADAWYAAWASHDKATILALYADDVRFVSPSVRFLVGEPSGTLHGRDALAGFLDAALPRFDDLTFQPLALMVGMGDSIALHYAGVGGVLVAEIVTLRDGVIATSNTHYATGFPEVAAAG